MRRDGRPIPTTWASASHGGRLDFRRAWRCEPRVVLLGPELRYGVRRFGTLMISMRSVERPIRTGTHQSRAGSHQPPPTVPGARPVRETMAVALIRFEGGRRAVRVDHQELSCERRSSCLRRRCERRGRWSGSRHRFHCPKAGRMTIPSVDRRWTPSSGRRHHGLSHQPTTVNLHLSRGDDRSPTNPGSSSRRLAWGRRRYDPHHQPTTVNLHLSRTDDRSDPQNLAVHSDATMNLCDQPFVESTPSARGIRLPSTRDRVSVEGPWTLCDGIGRHRGSPPP